MPYIIDHLLNPPREASVDKTHSNFRLILKCQNYFIKSGFTEKCHNMFADAIYKQLSHENTFFFDHAVINKQLSVTLLLNPCIYNESNHTTSLKQEDLGKDLSDKVLHTLSNKLKESINNINVIIESCSAVPSGHVGIQIGSNSFQSCEEDILLKVTCSTDEDMDGRAAPPFLVGYRQQTSVFIDHILLKSKLDDAKSLLNDSYIAFKLIENTDISNPKPVPEVTMPLTKNCSYQWSYNTDKKKNLLTLCIEDKTNKKHEIYFDIEFTPKIAEKKISTSVDNIQSTLENNVNETPITDSLLKATKIHENNLTIEETFHEINEEESNVVELNSNKRRKRQNEAFSAEETFVHIKPTLSLVLEGIISKGDYINKYGITHVETERLNGREQTPTNPAFIELGIEQLWQVNDKIVFDIEESTPILFGRNNEELNPLMKYQATNNTGERYPIARYGLSREHLKISKKNEHELSLSVVNEKSMPAFIVSDTKQIAINNELTFKEDERLLIGLFIFKLVNKR